MTAIPALRSPRSTVAAPMIASNAAPLNGPSGPCGALVVVVDVVVVGGVVVDVDAAVDVGGSVAVGGAVVVDVANALVEVLELADVGVAAVPSGELGATANATMAAPAIPITQKRLRMSPFSPLRSPDRRHPDTDEYSPPP
jgi:hypothetical protein